MATTRFGAAPSRSPSSDDPEARPWNASERATSRPGSAGMIDLARIRQRARLRLGIQDGSYDDFVLGRLARSAPRPGRGVLLWGGSAIGEVECRVGPDGIEFDPPARLPDPAGLEYELTAEISGAWIDARTLLGLGPGAVVDLDLEFGGHLTLLAGDLILARGDAVAVDDSLALRVLELIELEGPVEGEEAAPARGRGPSG